MSETTQRSAMRRYLRAIESELLDVDWRRRREYLDAAAQHLAETEGTGERQSPREYAASFRSALDLPPRKAVPLEHPLFHVWPTPFGWLAAGLAGVALVVGLLVAAQVAERMVLTGVTAGEALRQAVDTVLPVPRLLRSRYVGGGLLVAGWFAGQLASGLLLRRRPGWRVPVAAAAVAVAVAVAGAVGLGSL